MKFEKVSLETAQMFCRQAGIPSLAVQVNLDELSLPCRSTAKSSGYDFFLPYDITIEGYSSSLVPTFIKAELDDDKVLEIYPRSSYGTKKGLMLANTVGIIDADYYNNPDNEGHIMVCLKNMTDKSVQLTAGAKFCQGIIKQYFLMDGDEYGVGSNRTGGFGSTGDSSM